MKMELEMKEVTGGMDEATKAAFEALVARAMEDDDFAQKLEEMEDVDVCLKFLRENGLDISVDVLEKIAAAVGGAPIGANDKLSDKSLDEIVGGKKKDLAYHLGKFIQGLDKLFNNRRRF